MSTIIKRLAAIGIVGVVALASACSNSDDRGNRAQSGVDGTNGEGGSPDAGNTPAVASFPLYVQRLIETSTTDTAIPEAETAWGSLVDDEAYVAPAGFFD